MRMILLNVAAVLWAKTKFGRNIWPIKRCQGGVQVRCGVKEIMHFPVKVVILQKMAQRVKPPARKC